MKKVFIVLLLGVICLMCGCVYTVDSETPKRFEYVDNGYYGYFDIVRDTKTGVMYAVSDMPYSCGSVTVLVNTDGSPLLYEEYIK